MARFNPIIICKVDSDPPQAQPVATVAVTQSPVRMQFNAEKNGIELYFTDKPDVSVRKELKSAGFRWGFKSGCWYTKDTPQHRAWAEAFVARHNGVPAPAPTSAPVAPTVAVTQSPQVAAMPGMTPLGIKALSIPKQFMTTSSIDSENPPVALTQSALAIRHLNSLKHFIGPAQRAVLRDNFRGEEKDYFFEKVRELAELVANMPETGETDGQGRMAVAHLHYFASGQANWYITEKDKGSPDDEVKGVQQQAFGLADLFADGGELGYISIQEILQVGGELDFYFKPQTLAEVYAKEEKAKSGVTMWQEQSEVEATVEFSAAA